MNGFALFRPRNIMASFAVAVTLGGCAYPGNAGYDNYAYYDEYCDPNVAEDIYYECDNLNGYGDIGFNGGYYDGFFYPGHGLLLYDNFGRQFSLNEVQLFYWSQRRLDFRRRQLARRGGFAGVNVGRQARQPRQDGEAAVPARTERRAERQAERRAERRADGRTETREGTRAERRAARRAERRRNGQEAGRVRGRINRTGRPRNGAGPRPKRPWTSTGNRRVNLPKAAPASRAVPKATPKQNARPAKQSKAPTKTSSKPKSTTRSSSRPNTQRRARPVRQPRPRIQQPRRSPRTSSGRRRNPIP